MKRSEIQNSFKNLKKVISNTKRIDVDNILKKYENRQIKLKQKAFEFKSSGSFGNRLSMSVKNKTTLTSLPSISNVPTNPQFEKFNQSSNCEPYFKSTSKHVLQQCPTFVNSTQPYYGLERSPEPSARNMKLGPHSLCLKTQIQRDHWTAQNNKEFKSTANTGMFTNPLDPVDETIDFYAISVKGIVPIRPNKENQDRYCYETIQSSPLVNYLASSGQRDDEVVHQSKAEKQTLIAVFDGHGKNGSKASNFVMNQIKEVFKMQDFDFRDRNALTRIIETSHASLVKNVNCNLSGTTACVTVIYENKIVCANVGDSKAVLFSKDKSNKWDATQLSKIHNLESQSERERIEESGGVIRQFLNSEGNPFGPQRIWKQGENTPGLVMSRSCGDILAHSIGVISTPDILKTRFYSSKTNYLIVASDGLWEQLSNIDVMKLLRVHSDKSAEGICDLLYKKSHELWQCNEKIIDDITICVAIF